MAGQTPGTTQKIVLTALGGSVATPPEGLTAEVVVVDNWQQLHALPPGAVKGKILLFNHPFDKELAAAGDGLERLRRRRGLSRRGADRRRSGGSGGGAGADRWAERTSGLPHTGRDGVRAGCAEDSGCGGDGGGCGAAEGPRAQGPVRMHLTLTPQTLPDAQSYNVIADWKGTEHPEQVVVVSGHLDSWDLGTGAIDDGAGVVVSMQAIQLLKELGIHPRRTVRVCCVDERRRRIGGSGGLHDGSQGRVRQTISARSRAIWAQIIRREFTTRASRSWAQWLRPVSQVLDAIGAETLVSAPETGEDIAGLTREGCAQLCSGAGQPILFQLSPHGRGYLRQGGPQTPE